MKSINDHFNLRHSPFADTYPITAPYLSKTEAADIERMLMLIGEGKSFSITGEPGSGKSMLMRTLASKFDGKAYRIAHVAYSGQKPGAVLRDVCDQLRIDATGRGSLLARLRKSFSRSSENPFAVVLLDEAQDLPMESMFELFSLTHDTHERTSAASIVLCGHPVLEKRLALDSFASVKSRLACRFRAKPLDEAETRAFIAHRLATVKAPKEIFHEDALRLIGIDGKGNRRTIMNLAGNSLQLACARSENVVTADIAYEVCNEMK
jgi:type II secretory pathway predicted ATPase ExeA